MKIGGISLSPLKLKSDWKFEKKANEDKVTQEFSEELVDLDSRS